MTGLTAKWTLITSSPRLQRSSHTLSVEGDRAWIFGGELQPRQPVDNQLDVVEISNSPAEARTLAPNDQAPSPRVGSASTVLNGTIYIFSGRGGSAMTPIDERGSVWSFHTLTQRWTLLAPADPTAPHPAARSYHAMTSDGRGTLFVHAGCPERGRLSDLWAFDVAGRTWTVLPTAPGPPRGGASLAHADGELYRVNGFDGEREQGASVDVFNLGKGTWSTRTYAADGEGGPVARSVGALLAAKGGGEKEGETVLVTLFGERDPSSLGHAGAGKMLGDVWAYGTRTGSWVRVRESDGEGPQARGWFSAATARNSKGEESIMVHGGLAEDNSRLGDLWKLEIGRA